MKRVLFVGLLCAFAAPVLAGIASIEVIQAQGYTADYNHLTRQLDWSLGASATVYDDEGNSYYDGNVEVTATFTVVTDGSDGTWAEADFSTSSWRVDFNTFGGFINGQLKAGEAYNEVEGTEHPSLPIRIGANQLFGNAVVEVLGYDFGSLAGGTAVWDSGDSNMYAKLKSETILPTSPSFGDYDTDSYSADSTTIWIYADETVVPEPMTVLLLGLGAMVVRKRR